MKITLTGSLGHIGRPLTEALAQQGHTVSVISSNAAKQKDIESLGAVAAIGSIEDAGFLVSAFTGADAVYCMVPPTDYFDHRHDLVEFYRAVGSNYAQAIRQSGVKRVVHLSSVGAHLDRDSGIIIGHHAVEGMLKELPGVDTTHLRPTAFYYNLFGFLKGIKNTGKMASNYGAEDRVAWVSPKDIALAVAEELVAPLNGRKVRYVASEELSCSEVASVLGAAIGKPGLAWDVISDAQMLSHLEGIGMSPRIAAGMVEMNAGMHTGALFADYDLNRPTMGKVKMEDFAVEFAAAYNSLP